MSSINELPIEPPTETATAGKIQLKNDGTKTEDLLTANETVDDVGIVPVKDIAASDDACYRAFTKRKKQTKGIAHADESVGPEEPLRKKTKREDTPPSFDYHLSKDDVWLHILAFVGPGHYIFVAGVSRRFQELYRAYIATLPTPLPPIKCEKWPMSTLFSTVYSTFYRAAFSSVACAKYWDHDTTIDINLQSHRLHESRICYKIAKYGNIEVLKWARNEKGYTWGEATCAAAAHYGHLALLKYAHEAACPWNTNTCFEAAGGGHLHVLRYAHQHGCPLGWRTCANAAKGGHLDCLKYARDNGCRWNQTVTTFAAKHGHIHILEYARANGCVWSARTCSIAAQYGQFETLKWLHKNKCRWNERTCEYAAKNGHWDILKFAHQTGCPWNEKTCVGAAAHGYLEIAEWAHKNGCPWDRGVALGDAAEN